MKAGRIILLLVILIVLVAGIGAWWLTRNVDGMVSQAVTETGRELTGTRVAVDSVDVDLARGKASLGGLTISNPPGYSQRPALRFGSIEVDIALDSIREEVLRIEQVRVIDPQVSFELDAEGVSNISMLKGNIGSATTGQSSDGEKRLIIEQLDFSGGKITAIAAQRPGKELTFDFPSVSFSGLGSPGGATAGQIGDEVSPVLMDRIIQAAQRAGVDSLVEKQKERALDKIQDLLREKVDEIKDEDIGGGG